MNYKNIFNKILFWIFFLLRLYSIIIAFTYKTIIRKIRNTLEHTLNIYYFLNIWRLILFYINSCIFIDFFKLRWILQLKKRCLNYDWKFILKFINWHIFCLTVSFIIFFQIYWRYNAEIQTKSYILLSFNFDFSNMLYNYR